MDEIVRRILVRLEELKTDQKTFADEIGVSPTTITDWKTGKSKSYLKKINIISAVLASPLNWLVFGEGPHSKIEEARIDGTLERGERIARGEKVIQLLRDDGKNIEAAFFEGGEDLTQEEMDELWEDAKDYIQYKLDQRRRRKHDQ